MTAKCTIPIIHTTDLHHPPVDPDDHFDLATLYALSEFDVRAVVFDPKACGSLGGRYWEPGIIPVMQLNHITGRCPPVACGPEQPLDSPGDPCRDRERWEQAGVELILRSLRESDQPAFISVVGSCRPVTAAFNRDPQLMREKVRAVLLNAGGSDSVEGKLEYNVVIDVHAYVGLWRSGIQIWWFPCATSGDMDWTETANSGPHNTHWLADQGALLAGVSPAMKRWFTYGLTGNGRGDILRAIEGDDTGRTDMCGRIWDMLLAVPRQLWITASLIIASGRQLVQTPDGWRFVPEDSIDPAWAKQKLDLVPVHVDVADNGQTHRSDAPESSPHRLYERTPGPEHTQAMTEALAALLATL
jgi:hypothetical protein